jgi:hypothetical protein
MRTREELTYLTELMKLSFKLVELTETSDPFEIVDNIDKAVALFDELIAVAVDPQFKAEAEEKRANMVNLRQFVLDHSD